MKAKYDQIEMNNYENSLKTYRDLKGVMDTAYDEGKIKGKTETVKQLKVLGFSIGIIS